MPYHLATPALEGFQILPCRGTMVKCNRSKKGSREISLEIDVRVVQPGMAVGTDQDAFIRFPADRLEAPVGHERISSLKSFPVYSVWWNTSAARFSR